jgi:diguanylate cyclase (GGDEF)-like protein
MVYFGVIYLGGSYMAFTSLFLGKRKDPASLLRLYVTTAVISVATVVVLSSFSFYRVFSGFVIKSAKEDSVQLAHLLSDQQLTKMFKFFPGQGEHLAVEHKDMDQLDLKMREFLHPFNIIKIKIYDADRKIIYSTESSLIGKIDENNLRLKNALGGNVDAQQVTKEKARDLADEPLMDVDVVETYVPIRSLGSNAAGVNSRNKPAPAVILGSFEIYVNVTKYRDQIRIGVAVMTTITAAMLLTVFGSSYILIRDRTLQLKAAHSKLEVLAITDGLTGVANRSYVMKRGAEEFTRAVRKKERGADASTLCCLMLDIDHFKNVNDTKGHPGGDEVLRQLVCRIRKSVRPYDIVGRYGGEEFLLLLPDTAFKEGVVVAERIRTDINREAFRVCGDDMCISVSLGIASLDEKDQNLDDLLKRADEGLYKAKHAGRDRVEWIFSQLETEQFAFNSTTELV